LETSALLRLLIDGDAAIQATIRTAAKIVTSSLTIIEADRGIRRAVAGGQLSSLQGRRALDRLDGIMVACEIIDIDDRIIKYVQRDYPVEPVRTLDAIHLASLHFWATTIESVTVLSCDRRVRENCVAWGYAVVPR